MTRVGFIVEPYDNAAKAMLAASDHYLRNATPGALFAVMVRDMVPGLFGDDPGGAWRGICLVGRPTARMLPQDGSWAEVTRLWLSPGLPHGTASAVLRHAFEAARARGIEVVISYHDRTRHTGCIYRKAGMRRWGTMTPSGAGWASRNRPASGAYKATPKRRWRIDLAEAVIA